MNKPGFMLPVFCAMAVAATQAVWAQGDSTAKTVKVRFRLYGWDEPVTDLNYNMRGSDKELVVYHETRSIFYDYSGPEVIVFYRLKTDSEGKVVREPAAQANLSGAGPWPLIVLCNNNAKPGSYQILVLRDDLISFPAGSYAFSNFTTSQVGGLLGTEPFTLSPGENKLLSGRPHDNGTTLAALFYKITGSDKEALYTNNWAIRPATRTRVFVKTSTETPTGIIARRLVESTIFPPEKEREISKTE